VVDDAQPLVVAYLGALLPDPARVRAFVDDLVAGQAEPPCFPGPPAVLRARLADRALALAG